MARLDWPSRLPVMMGTMAITERNIAPKKVILPRTLRIKSAVGLPGRKPGTKPPFFFRLLATSMGLKAMVE